MTFRAGRVKIVVKGSKRYAPAVFAVRRAGDDFGRREISRTP